MSGCSVGASQTLSPREQARLTAILSRLSSSFDNERAAAGLLATAFVARHNLTWSNVVEMLRPPPGLPVTSGERQSKRERRRGGNQWRGYCRRRRVGRGAAVDLSA